MTKTLTLQTIIDECDFRLKNNREMDKFMDRLTGGEDPEKANPVYAFQWAEGAISESVKKQEVMRLKYAAEHWLEKINEAGADVESTETAAIATITEFYQRELMNKVTRYASSTSGLSNMIENYERVVYDQIVVFLTNSFLSGF